MLNSLVASLEPGVATSTVREPATSRHNLLRYLPNFLTLILLLIIAANYFGTFADLDFAWQIRTGEQIIEQGTLLPPDAFTYTIHGKHIPDYEWLYEVTLYGIWSVFGYGGLKFLRVVLVATPFVLVALRLKANGVRWHGILISLFLAGFVLSPAWNLRPMYCTTIGLLLVSWWLRDHCTGKRPLTWWLPLVMLLWSNLHPSVITGQGLLFGAIAWEWLNRWLKWNPTLDDAALRRLTTIGGLGFLATFISPDPIGRLLYPFNPELAHPVQRFFVEMQPLYTFVARPPYATGLVYVVAALVLVTIVLRFRHYRMWELMLLLGLTVLANVAVRGIQDWLLLMLALGVPHMAVLLGQVAKKRRRFWAKCILRLDRKVKRIFNPRLFGFQRRWVLGALAGLFVISVIPPISRAMPNQNAHEWPVAAVDHIETAGLRGRFFASPDYGAFLTWRLGTEVQTYTDTRGFFFPPMFLEDSLYIQKMDEGWRERLARVLDDYHTEYFLLETTLDRGEMWRRLQKHIDKPLFLDDNTVVLSAAQVRYGIAQLKN
jgi:hypothetical protein